MYRRDLVAVAAEGGHGFKRVPRGAFEYCPSVCSGDAPPVVSWRALPPNKTSLTGGPAVVAVFAGNQQQKPSPSPHEAWVSGAWRERITASTGAPACCNEAFIVPPFFKCL